MKKIALLASVAVLSTAAMASSPACSVTGFYAGANAGVASTEGKFKVENTKISGRSVQYGAFSGYNMGLGNGVVVGGEVFLGGDNSKVSRTTNNVKTEMKRTLNYGIAPRVGYMITPSVLAYVRLGLEAGSWKLSVTDQRTAKKNKVSFAPGLGFDIFASKNVFVRAQYHHAFGPKVKKDAVEVKASQSVFALGFGYKF